MKPRIYKLWGSVWACYSRPTKNTSVTGIGGTPAEAYRVWAEANVKYKGSKS